MPQQLLPHRGRSKSRTRLTSAAADSGDRPGGRRPLVLVVDDDRDARAIFSMFLRAHGCDVATARDGYEALRKAAELWPDVISMDLAMPRLDGWEAIRRLNESSWTRKIPTIAVSAVPLSREEAFAAGCDAYLAKPLDPLVLWQQIRAMLRIADEGDET